jgi:hypothetical protein
MVRNLGRLFCGILGWVFFGDVLNNMFQHFRRDGAESFVPKWMVRNLGRLFCGILGWVFFGDVLNNSFLRIIDVYNYI